MDMILLLAVTVLLAAANAIAMKYVPEGSSRVPLLVTAVYTAPIFLVYLLIVLLGGEAVSGPTVGWGLVRGIGYVVTVAANVFALQCGPLSYTTFIYAAGMVIPVFGSALLWGESIRPLQWVGIVLFLVSFYFICVLGKERGQKASRRWLPLCLIAGVGNGSLMLVAKIQQMALQGQEATSMLAITYGTASLLSLLCFLLMAPLQKERLFPAPMAGAFRVALLPIALIAVTNGSVNFLTTYLSSRVDGAWLFPCVLGGNLLLVTLFSVLFLKEKLNRYGAIGMLCGVCAIVALNV